MMSSLFGSRRSGTEPVSCAAQLSDSGHHPGPRSPILSNLRYGSRKRETRQSAKLRLGAHRSSCERIKPTETRLTLVITVTALPTPGLRNGGLSEGISALLLADASGNGLLRGLLRRHLCCKRGLLSHLLSGLLGHLLSGECSLLRHMLCRLLSSLLGHLLRGLLGHLLSSHCGLLSHLLGGLLRRLLGHLLGRISGLLGQRLGCLLCRLMSHLLRNFRRLLRCMLNRLHRLWWTEELAAHTAGIVAILRNAKGSATARSDWPAQLSEEANTANRLRRLAEKVARPALAPAIRILIRVG